MQRFVTGLAFVLGFAGVMALGAGWPRASGSDSGPNGSVAPQWRLLPGNPSHTQFGALQPDGTYRGVVSPDEDLTPMGAPDRAPSHTSFGTLQPDGSYCSVCVPYDPDANDHP
jgi:hypothetical protein